MSKNKFTQPPATEQPKRVTVTGQIRPEAIKLPSDFPQSPIFQDGDVGIIQLTLADGSTYVLDRCGINIGLPANKVDEIKAALESTTAFRLDKNYQVFQILSNDGKNQSDYSEADATAIIQVMRSSPELTRRHLKAFVEERVDG